jgi:serine/threonine-protein kinase
VLLPELSHSAELVQRFFVEARATAQLRHPAFVEVFDSGTLPDGSAYLVMEHLQGETLGERLAHHTRLPVPEALAVTREIAAGVGHAHRHGIVHRDLKPDNVFLTEAGQGETSQPARIKVLDFGIAKLTTSAAGSGSRTRTGMILGTPLFMAPEQCRGAGNVTLDQRVDVYALGCILHLMLAGEPPFPLEGFGEIISAHLNTPPPPLRSRQASVPPAVEALVLRMLAKRPEDRPASMEAVVAELDRLLAGTPTIVAPEPAPRLPRTEKLPTARASTGGLSTFTSAASVVQELPEEQPAGSGRSRWIAGGAVALVVAIAVAVWGGSSRKPRPAPAARPVEVVTPPPSRPAPQPPPPPVEKAPATVVISIDSTPAGAEVVDASGTVLGNTPFVGRFPAGEGQAKLGLQKEGFRAKHLTLPLERDQTLSVTLEKRPAAPRPRPAPAKPKDDDNDRRKL